MGRKRKAGALPVPLSPSLSGASYAKVAPATKKFSAPPSKDSNLRNRQPTHSAAPTSTTTEHVESKKRDKCVEERRTTSTAPAPQQLSSCQPRFAAGSESVLTPLSDTQDLLPSPTKAHSSCSRVSSPAFVPPTPKIAAAHVAGGRRCPPQEERAPSVHHQHPVEKEDISTLSARSSHSALMTQSEAVAQLLPAQGWRLGSCWGPGCHCTLFRSGNGATTSTCLCGHHPEAHELVDADAEEGKSSCGRGSRHSNAAGDTARLAVGLRRLFTAIRNARAIGDSGLFEDSEGVRGWGVGWFLSGNARRYMKQARQVVAELGAACHDASAITRCLATAEALLSGDGSREWATPNSLPPASIYQALGTGIASELDLAYWHVRYTAASRFEAGGIPAGSTVYVVPPPEVYFVCLAFHIPSASSLRTLPGTENAALAHIIAEVFDFSLRTGAAAGAGSSEALGSKHIEYEQEIRFPILSNPLLAVTQSTWLETAVCAGARSWVPHFPSSFGKPEGTMRGSDPALPDPIRARCDATRDWSARLLAFAVPNRRAIEACRRAVDACGSQAAGIVEVGAGLGYWKWILEGEGEAVEARHEIHLESSVGTPVRHRRNAHGRANGAATPLRVLALDKDPATVSSSAYFVADASSVAADRRKDELFEHAKRGREEIGRDRRAWRGKTAGGETRRRGNGPKPTSHCNEYHGGAPSWAVVEEGTPERLCSLSGDDFPILLLCYPPPSIAGGAGRAACMGTKALAYFRGKVLLYIGEAGGDTGSPQLEAAVQKGWDMVEEVNLPCFSSTANKLMVFFKKGQVFLTDDYQEVKVLVGGKRDVGTKAVVPEVLDGCRKPLAMYRCSRCELPGGDKVHLRRCRLTRAVSFCSEKCMSLDRDTYRAHLDARHIHLATNGASGRGRDCGGKFHDKKLFKRLALGHLKSHD